MQDAVGYADFANVMQLRGKINHSRELRGEPEGAGQHRCVSPHADDVPARVVVPIFRRAGQTEDHFPPGRFQRLGPLPDSSLELRGVILEMVPVLLRLDHVP